MASGAVKTTALIVHVEREMPLVSHLLSQISVGALAVTHIEVWW